MTPTLVIMAAGTGGHVIPGLAVAKEMQNRGWNVHWLATSHGMENTLVPPHGFTMTKLNFSGLRGKGLLHSVLGLGKLISSTWRAVRLFKQIQPNVVLGMGGYVTVPGGWATRFLQLPLALVNADAGLLMSNRALLGFAKRIMFGFQGEQVEGLGEKAIVTGNPVRNEIAALEPPLQRYAGREGVLRLLVVGGSLGAQVLNEVVPSALASLPEGQRPKVTHQSGKAHIDSLTQRYQQANVEADVLPFIEDMAHAYREADLVICRAGAITVSELAVAGVPSILVPFVVSTTSHQRDNAEWMAKQEAAIHLPQTELSPQRLAQLLTSLDRTTLIKMASAAKGLGKPEATSAIADELERMAR